MKIIKEGKNPNELPFTCDDCGCEFIVDKADDIYCHGRFPTLYYVKCPCCGKEFQIWDFQAERLLNK